MKLKAKYDYTLADLIAFSCNRLRNNNAQMPKLEAAYAFLYNSEEDIKKRESDEAKVFSLRLRLFADNFNARH